MTKTDREATMTVNERTGAEIRAWTARLGYTQGHGAKILGVAQTRVSARLRGKVTFGIDELAVRAQDYGISLGALLASQLINEQNPRPAVRDEGLSALPQLESNQ